MARPLIEYANPVWLPHAHKDIERVQRQCARFITGDYSRFSSVTNLLSDFNIPSLECRREVSSIILFYKIVNNFPHPTDLIPVNSSTRGHNQNFCQIYARTTQYSNSFFPKSIRLWNSLPQELIQQPPLSILKQQLKSFIFSAN